MVLLHFFKNFSVGFKSLTQCHENQRGCRKEKNAKTDERFIAKNGTETVGRCRCNLLHLRRYPLPEDAPQLIRYSLTFFGIFLFLEKYIAQIMILCYAVYMKSRFEVVVWSPQ